jgi:hypothetical protein
MAERPRRFRRPACKGRRIKRPASARRLKDVRRPALGVIDPMESALIGPAIRKTRSSENPTKLL